MATELAAPQQLHAGQASLAGGQFARPGPSPRAQAWMRRLPLLPALIYMIVVTQVPFIVTLWFSLRGWNTLVPGSNKFTGLHEYRLAFDDPTFRNAAVSTVELTASAVIFSMLLGTALAILVNRQFFGRGIVRTLLITPFLVVPVASAELFKYSFYDAQYGLLNWALKPFGLADSAGWTGSHAMGSVVAVLVWEWAPFMMLIVLAGLQGEPLDALEAAEVDGADVIRRFVFITLPHLRRYIELGLLLGSIYILQTFGEIYVLTGGGGGSSGTATTNLPYYLYEQVFQSFNVGVGAAAGVIVVVATEIVATFTLRLLAGILTAAVE